MTGVFIDNSKYLKIFVYVGLGIMCYHWGTISGGI